MNSYWAALQAKHLPACTYCGEPATHRDHVPPRKLRPTNTTTVPACLDCNIRILGDKPLMTVQARKKYVEEVHRDRERTKNYRLTQPTAANDSGED